MTLTVYKSTVKFIRSVILILSLLVCILGYEIYDSYRKEVDKATTDAKNISLAIDEYLTASFRNIDIAMLTIVETCEENLKQDGHFHLNTIHKILKNRDDNLFEVQGFRLANSSGKVIEMSESPLQSFETSDRDYYKYLQTHNDKNLFISEPIIGRINKVPSIALAHRINFPNGKFAGLIFTAVKLEHLSKFLSTLGIGANSAISILNNNRTLLMRFPNNSEQIGYKILAQSQLQLLIDQKKVSGVYWVTSQIDQVKRIYSYRKNKIFPVVVHVGIADIDFLAKWKKRVATEAVIIVLMFILSIITMRRYISSARQVESERMRMVQASKLSSLGAMASGIAHEINNPLMIIVGNVEKISWDISNSDLSKKIKDETLDSLSKIEKTVQRIADSVRGLLAFSRKSDRDPMTIVTVQKILDDTIPVCQDKFHHNGIELRIQPSESASILCRESQIIQVLTNILNNACDAVIPLEIKWINIGTKIQDKNIKITITDSGLGIPPEIALHIMEPFFTTKAAGKGTGLGLSISKEIIEEHNGVLSFDSNSANTTFIVEIPLA